MDRYTFGTYRFKGGDRLKGGPTNLKYDKLDDFRYDEKYAQSLLDSRQYDKYADYQSNFEDVDVAKQRAFELQMKKDRQIWARQKAIHDKASANQDYAEAIDYWESISEPGGVNKLRSYYKTQPKVNGEYKSNKYLDEAAELIKNMGGEDATHLSITFKGAKQNLFNNDLDNIPVIGWLTDVLDKDNENTIEQFYATSGLTRNDLEKNGVEIIEDGGNTTIRFAKSNNLTHNILYNVPKATTSSRYQPRLESYVQNEDGTFEQTWNTQRNTFYRRDYFGLRPYIDLLGGGVVGTVLDNITNPRSLFGDNEPANLISRHMTNNAQNSLLGYINRMSSDNNYISGDLRQGGAESWLDKNSALSEFSRLVDDARFKSEEIYDSFEKDLTYSTLVGGELWDGLEELNALYNRGDITPAEYRARREELGADKLSLIRAMGSSGYEFWSNYNNDDPEDETVEQLSNNDRARLLNYIQGVSESRLNAYAGMMNDQFGTWIVVNRPSTKVDTDDAKIFDVGNESEIAVFIPGLWTEEAQNKINNDSATRSRNEINELQKWEYAYNTLDGDNVSYDKYTGNWIHKYSDGQQEAIDAESARLIIERDMLAEDGATAIKYNYLNARGEITDLEGYRQAAMQTAYAAANALKPDVPLLKDYNDPSTIMSVSEVFNNIFLNDSQGFVPIINDEYYDTLNYKVSDKLKDIAYLYQVYMDAIKNN